MTTAYEFQVRRNDLAQTRWVEAQAGDDQPVEVGEALLRIESFGLTSNNVTYGVVGHLMHYWEFFPAPEGWGRIPVWGFAEVVSSRAPGVEVGDRFFGYLPIATFLRVHPDQADAHGFVDASAHRAALPAPYQRYSRTTRGQSARDAARAVLSPLFGTGFLIDDFLHHNGLFGARQVALVSASSRTALATAFSLSRRIDRQFEIVALTSARNRGFCERVGYYDRVVEYGQLETLPSVPTVLVDMAADTNVLRAIYQRLGAALRYNCLVGMTHHTGPLTTPAALPEPAPQMFSAPLQIERWRTQRGAAELDRLVGAAQSAFFESAERWLVIDQRQGREAIEAAYRSVLTGQATPDRSIVLSF